MNTRSAATLGAGFVLGIGLMAMTAMCTPPADEAPEQETSVVTEQPVEPIPTVGIDGRATGPITDYDTDVLFCGVNAGVATDVDEYGNAWAYCEPGMVG